MQAYKLTGRDNKTYGFTLWGKNVTHETNGEGELCGPGWLHFYSSPHLALLLNPMHAGIYDPKLWVAEAEGDFKHDRGLKSGCTKLTTIQEIDIPVITEKQKMFFAISCAQKVCEDKAWNEWATNWINNIDRSSKTARNVSDIAYKDICNINIDPKKYKATSSAYHSAQMVTFGNNHFVSYAADWAADIVELDFESMIKEMLSFQG